MIELNVFSPIPYFIHEKATDIMDATKENLYFFREMVDELTDEVTAVEGTNGIALPEIGVNVRALVIKVGVGTYVWCNPSYTAMEGSGLWRTTEQCICSASDFKSLKPDHVTFKYQLPSALGTDTFTSFESCHKGDREHDIFGRKTMFIIMHLIDHANGTFGYRHTRISKD